MSMVMTELSALKSPSFDPGHRSSVMSWARSHFLHGYHTYLQLSRLCALYIKGYWYKLWFSPLDIGRHVSHADPTLDC